VQIRREDVGCGDAVFGGLFVDAETISESVATSAYRISSFLSACRSGLRLLQPEMSLELVSTNCFLGRYILAVKILRNFVLEARVGESVAGDLALLRHDFRFVVHPHSRNNAPRQNAHRKRDQYGSDCNDRPVHPNLSLQNRPAEIRFDDFIRPDQWSRSRC
jgi:hypothetical protein